MINKIILRLIVVISLLLMVSLLHSHYTLFILYAGNWSKLFHALFPFHFLEFIVVLCCFIGGLKHFQYTPLFGVIYIKTWLFGGINTLDKYINDPSPVQFNFYSWGEPFFFNKVFILNWIFVISEILLALLCVTGMIIVIKTRYQKKDAV